MNIKEWFAYATMAENVTRLFCLMRILNLPRLSDKGLLTSKQE